MKDVTERLREYDILAWAGLAIGIVGVLTGPVFGWSSGALFGFGALGAIAGIILGIILTLPKKYPFQCLECRMSYVLTGQRGAAAKTSEMTLLKATREQDLFIYAKLRREGLVKNETLRYRSRGKSVDNQTQNFVLLGPNRVLLIKNIDGTIDLSIRLPAPVRRNEILEIVREYEVDGAFPQDEEFVGKGMLWPTNDLKFKLEFVGANVADCQGVRLNNSNAAFSADPLPITAGSAGQQVSWGAGETAVGENCRVTWRWL